VVYLVVVGKKRPGREDPDSIDPHGHESEESSSAPAGGKPLENAADAAGKPSENPS